MYEEKIEEIIEEMEILMQLIDLYITTNGID
jgi:hypothetical protein